VSQQRPGSVLIYNLYTSRGERLVTGTPTNGPDQRPTWSTRYRSISLWLTGRELLRLPTSASTLTQSQTMSILAE
jgi:hypothetical protein